MQLELMTLCDRVQNQAGRLTLHGLFEALHLPRVPAALPTCGLFVRLRYWPPEAGSHRLSFYFVNADGQPLDTAPALEHVFPPVTERPHAAISIPISLAGLRVPAYGEYSVHFEVDGDELGVLPFFVLPPGPPN